MAPVSMDSRKARAKLAPSFSGPPPISAGTRPEMANQMTPSIKRARILLTGSANVPPATVSATPAAATPGTGWGPPCQLEPSQYRWVPGGSPWA